MRLQVQRALGAAEVSCVWFSLQFSANKLPSQSQICNTLLLDEKHVQKKRDSLLMRSLSRKLREDTPYSGLGHMTILAAILWLGTLTARVTHPSVWKTPNQVGWPIPVRMTVMNCLQELCLGWDPGEGVEGIWKRDGAGSGKRWEGIKGD